MVMNSLDEEPLRKSRFLTTEEVAARLRQKPRTITWWATVYQNSGGAQGIRGVKFGRRWLFDEADILALIGKRSGEKTA